MSNYDTSGPVAGIARSLSGAAITQGGTYGVATAVDWVSVQVNLTAIGGTATTLDLAVQWSMDGGTTWSDADTADSFSQLLLAGGAKSVVKRFPVKAPTFRLKEVLAGTSPTATYTPTVYFR